MEAAAKGVVVFAVALLAACAASTGADGYGVLNGDTCTLHQDASSCRTDPQDCTWYPNTRPCYAGQPCPAGYCYHPQPLDGGSCTCPAMPSDVCVMQVGGPAALLGPPIVCEAIPASCAQPDRCACLVQQGTMERCWSSNAVANLCSCDNGMR